MPGLFGVFATNGECLDEARTEALLAEMSDRLTHVPGEVTELWLDGARGFAIGRVGRPALQPSPWPRRGVDGEPRFFVDGELKIAENSRFSSATASRLRTARGSFSVACFDPSARSLTLATDRRASRPIAFTRIGGQIFFAPEAKALLAVPGVDKRLDFASLGLILTAGYTLGTRALFASVRKLAGGELLLLASGDARVEPYWSYRLSNAIGGAPAQRLEAELAALLGEVCSESVDDPSRTAVFLSGGVESRLIAEAASRAVTTRGGRLATLTWQAPNPREGADHEVAAKIALRIGSRHRTLVRHVRDYAAEFARVSYLVDAQSDLPAFHGHEFTLMQQLADEGIGAVVRGDACYGQAESVESADEALFELGLGGARRFDACSALLRPEALQALELEGARALDGAIVELGHDHPDDAYEELYFRHRLQGYLNVAAYPKAVVVRHETPLLDNRILDFMGRVPPALRVGRRLFCAAARRRDRELWAIPFAGRGNLERWPDLLAERSAVRRYVDVELADRQSGFWEFACRRALLNLVAELRAPEHGRFERARAASRQALREAIGVVPGVDRRLRRRARRSPLKPYVALMRLLVLKQWHDVFITADGSRRAFTANMSRIESALVQAIA